MDLRFVHKWHYKMRLKKTFFLRVDVESDKGIKEGVPKLLDLLKEHNIKASFYLVMGGESNILELLKYRNLKNTNSMSGFLSGDNRKVKLWSLKDKLRMAFFPKDFVRNNLDILKRILKEGHELGIHGWKHREWTRGLDTINIRKAIRKAKEKYEKIFGKYPISFASPGFNINEKVLKILEEEGFKYISDLEGEDVEKKQGIKNVPVTIIGKRKTPIIEYLISKGKTDDEILFEFKDLIKEKGVVSFYIHDLYEARFKLRLLEKIFSLIKDNKIENKRIIDY